MQKLVFILIVSALAIWVGNKAAKTPIAMNDVILKNIDALADGESGTRITCDWSGNLSCPNTGDKVGAVYEGYSLRP